MHKQAQSRHTELVKLIREADYNYYVLDRPQMTDFAYDHLYSELLELEKQHPEFVSPDSPSQRVAGAPAAFFEKAAHRLPMLSLANSYSPEDLFDFDNRVKKFLNTDQDIEYFCEPKFDGLAMELIYEHGLLTTALTRGDGTVGENVTSNIRTIKSIPLALKTKNPPALLEVRGEVLIFKKDFLKLNQQQEDFGEDTFANPRNAAAGTVRQLDPKIAAQRPLRFFAYALGATEGVEFKTHAQIEDYLQSVGFPVAKDYVRICQNADEVVSYYHNLEKLRLQLPYEIDGLVTKVNSLALQQDLGVVARSPRWATAAKFKPEQARTVIEDIIVQVGRTGALTPVAIMKPVKVGGVTVTNATLHNQDEINRKDVRIGDTVVVQRAGDVIPEVVSVDLDKRSSTATPFVIPAQCPICHSLTIKPEGEAVSRCPNALCPARIKESLKHFVSRRAMNLDKVGDKLIGELVERGLVKCFSDLYQLSREDILSLDRKAEKSTDNILRSIEKSKNTTLARFIFALGIRFVGEQTAKALADHYVSVEAFLSATAESLLSIPDVGPRVADSILAAVNDAKLKADILRLLDLGVNVSGPTRASSGLLVNKSFLITGTLPVKRDEAKDFIEKNGGKILSGVSSKLDYLVVGDDPGSKLEKAQNLGVEIIDWDGLVSLVNKP